MMKKILCCIFCMAMAINASAQTLDYLTFRTVDGVERSLPVDGLKMTFTNNQLHAVAQGQVADFNLMDLSIMFFAPTATAIESVRGEHQKVAIVDGKLWVKAPEGAEIRVYSYDGRQINREAPLHGIYLVKVNGQTYKVMGK